VVANDVPATFLTLAVSAMLAEGRGIVLARGPPHGPVDRDAVVAELKSRTRQKLDLKGFRFAANRFGPRFHEAACV